MAESFCPTDRINSFAAVCYIPGEVGEFLTELRRELVTGCVARSHVSVLPPRPLPTNVDQAAEFFRRTVSPVRRFTLDMPAIEIFGSTLVVFLAVGQGAEEIKDLHDRLNTGPLFYHEPYPFHPHITLAQGISPAEFPRVRETAARRWSEASLRNSVEIESVTFVQNTCGNCWIDLVDCELQPA